MDDDASHLRISKLFLERNDRFQVTSMESPQQVLDEGVDGYDCLIVDHNMPGMSGVELAEKIRALSTVPIIVFTGRGSEEVAAQAFHAGVNDYVKKSPDPSSYTLLKNRVIHAVEKAEALEALERSMERLRDYSRRLELMLEHATKLRENQSIQDILDYSCHILHELLGYNTGSFGYVSDGNLIHFYVWGRQIERNVAMPLNGRGITVRAAVTGVTQSVSDVSLDPDYVFLDELDIEGVGSELDVPLSIRGNVIGVLNLESEVRGAFTSDDQRIVELLVRHISSVLECMLSHDKGDDLGERFKDTVFTNSTNNMFTGGAAEPVPA
ncbi:response regulator [Candidatus Bathyarchaeota archaeon]|nr:response regulator [Candidatus Bathyarchaeota archaeon]